MSTQTPTEPNGLENLQNLLKSASTLDLLLEVVEDCSKFIEQKKSEIDELRDNRRASSTRQIKGSYRVKIQKLQSEIDEAEGIKSEALQKMESSIEDFDLQRASTQGKDSTWLAKHEVGLKTTLENIPSSILKKAKSAKMQATKESATALKTQLETIQAKIKAKDDSAATDAEDFLRKYDSVLYARISGTEDGKKRFVETFLSAVTSTFTDKKSV